MCHFKYLSFLALSLSVLPGLSAASLVGSLPGDVSVTNTGSAVYSLPITLPAGVAGMAPELSVNYVSSSDNGLLGMSFSLDGLSAISRVPANLEQDDFSDGIDFDAKDRFSLDGQRLVCVEGTYGATSSKYRTEIDSFVRVTAYGTATSGPDYFIVETKAGLKKTYGQTNATSLVYDLDDDVRDNYGDLPAYYVDNFDEAKISWLLEKIEDTNGNTINFTYVQDSDSQQKYISEITYGAAGNTQKVAFEYEERDDAVPSFLRGVDFAISLRLSKIRVYSGGVEISNYMLGYDYSPQRPLSRLRSMTYTDVTSGDTLRSAYDWQDAAAVTSFGPKTDWMNYNGSTAGETYVKDVSNYSTLKAMLDINGDGLLDRLKAAATGILVRINNGSGFESEVLWPLSSKAEQNYVEWVSNTDLDDRDIYSRFLDMNGDGLPDRVDHQQYASNGQVSGVGIYVSLNLGNGFAARASWLQCTVSGSSLLQSQQDTNIYYDLIDMNADGLPDRVASQNVTTGQAGIWVYLNNGNGFDSGALWHNSSQAEQNRIQWAEQTTPERLGNYSAYIYSGLIDVNGDQRPDKVDNMNYATAKYGAWVSLNNGSGFDPMVNWLPGGDSDFAVYNYVERRYYRINNGGYSIYGGFYDENGDGMIDYSQGSKHYLNNGSGFEPWLLGAEMEKYVEGSGITRKLLDMNGDGILDRVESYFSEQDEWIEYDQDFEGNPIEYNNGPLSKSTFIRYYIQNGLSGDSHSYLISNYWYKYSDATVHPNVTNFTENNIDFWPKAVTWIDSDGTYSQSVLSDLIDINGDALPDFLGEGEFYLNNGDYVDLIGPWYSTPRAEQKYVSWISNEGDVYSSWIDMNGDGFPDRVDHANYDQSSSGDLGLWVSLNQFKPTLLSKVTNYIGTTGVSTFISYKPLTDKSVYRKGTGAVYPTIDIQTPMQVVSSITKDVGLDDANGNPIPYTTEYTYAEARYHTQGRGFLGFRVFESHDVQTDLTKTEILRHDFPYTGMKEASMTYGPNGQLLSRTVNTLDTKALNSGLTLFPYNAASEEWKAEFQASTDFSSYDEAALITHLESSAYGNTTTTNEFDVNGNNLEIFIDYGDGYTQRTINSYAYDNVDAWFLGRLSESTVISTAPDATPAP